MPSATAGGKEGVEGFAVGEDVVVQHLAEESGGEVEVNAALDAGVDNGVVGDGGGAEAGRWHGVEDGDCFGGEAGAGVGGDEGGVGEDGAGVAGGKAVVK